MRIREYTESDLDALRRMHARQGFGYAFPDLRDPLFVSKLVVESDDGRPVMASLARLTCEMYLLVDRAEPNVGEGKSPAGGTGNSADGHSEECSGAGGRGARDRYAQLLALHAAGEQDFSRAASRTRMRGCRRPSRAALAAASRRLAGCATIVGRRIAEG